MIFSIDRDVLLENLNLISHGLPVRTAMPVLTGIKLELTDKDLFLTASNTDISVQVVINDSSLEITEPGKVIIPGNYFIQIIRKINSRKISISLMEDKIVIIKSERSEFKLNLLSVLDYPNIDFVALDNPLNLQAKTLKSIIKEIAFATAQTEKRPILTGVSLKNTGNSLKATATDSYRLSQKVIELDNNYDDFNMVILSKSLDELGKILEGYNDNVEVYFNKIKILFKFKNILFQSRLLDGNYPDTSRLIPDAFPVIVKFNKEELIDAVERVSLLSAKDKENNNYIVKFHVKNDHVIEVSSTSSEVGGAIEEIIPTAPVIGPELKLAFSSRYLLEALKSCVSSEITLSFTGEYKPFIITGNDDLNLIHLILPIRTDW